MESILVGVPQACHALGLGRTKLNELMNEGVLEKRKIGRRTLITTESIRKLAGPPADIGSVATQPPHSTSGGANG